MPLHKESNGWYWGSKGPFETREKAVQVAQAAYAHGYKGGSTPATKKRKAKSELTRVS